MTRPFFVTASLLITISVAAYLFFESPKQETPSLKAIKLPLSLGTPDDPHAQAEMEFMIMRDPAVNEIPRNIHAKERELANRLPARSERSLAKGGSSLVWTERGPNNIGGRSRVFACDIVNPDILIAGSVAGGIWRSTNDGSSWLLTTAPWQIHTTTCIVQDTRPGRTNTWYVGTGEFRGSTTNDTRWGSLYRGDGVFKSTDNGLTWNLLPSTSSGTPNITDSFDYIWRVAIDPSEPSMDELLVATYNGIYRSSDGGGSWAQVVAADSSFTDVVVGENGIAYGYTRQGGITKLWRSVDGVNWANITPANFPASTGRVVIGLSPSNQDVIYFFVNVSGSSHQFWKYTDNTSTWENRSANLPGDLSTQTGYDQTLHVKPDDENFVVIGGTNLYRSTNGFSTSAATTTIGGYPYWPGLNHHPDLQSGFFRPGSPNVYYSGHDGGLSKSTDIGVSNVSWISLNNGYNVTQFYSVSICPDSASDIIMAGAQDNGTLMGNLPGASDWVMVFGGDGTVVKVPRLADNRLYTQYQNGQMQRHTLSITGTVNITPSGSTRQLFVNPIALDPNNTRILYYGGGRSSPTLTSAIWRNDNAPNATTTTGWTAITATDVGEGIGYSRRISTINVSKADSSNVVYYGTTDGVVKRVDNANTPTPTVTTITPPGLNGGTSTGGFVRGLAIDPTNSNNVLLAFGNYNFLNLWYTTDGGATWTDVEGNLAGPSGPSVRWATIFYVDGAQQVFIGTSIGLLSTATLNGSSTVWTQEAPAEIGNILIAMMDYREDDRTLAVGTHARGVFSTQFDSPVGVGEPREVPGEFMLAQNYPNPFNPSTHFDFTIADFGLVTLTVHDMLGREVATLVNEEKQPGTYTVNWNAKGLASGMYLYNLQAGDFVATKKLLLLR